jgi:putative hemolysin
MPSPPTLSTPFSLNSGRHTQGLLGRTTAIAAAVLDPLLGLTTLGRLYAELPGDNFIEQALERLGVSIDITAEQLGHVPATGSTIVVANHPTGALDGLALAHALLQRRPDVRLLGNHLLARVPEMRDRIIAVNPFDPRSIENRRGLRAAREWLAGGGLLVIFPAGEVSNTAGADGNSVDASWRRGVLRLIAWSSAPVVPAFVNAQPSRWLRLAGLVHPRLRTALLPRELLRLRNRSVGVRFSPAITAKALATLGGTDAPLSYLRARTYALAGGQTGQRHSEPVTAAVDAAELRENIGRLTLAHELLRSGDYSVYCAPAALIPSLLREIGRLRELTFRAVGEGSGHAIDLDRFDRDYEHLFVWNRTRSEVVGAYRIARTDRLCAKGGVAALYTHSLFALEPSFIRAAGPALELGRSFVRAEYQRDTIALLLLWKGIGALVAREPRYRRLFGPVSISAAYSPAARMLMAAYLQAAGGAKPWGDYVQPRRRAGAEPWVQSLVGQTASFDDLDRMVAELERGPGVPVLLRQYWKLGARVLGLTVDPSFNHSLDALILVDLAQMPPAALHRYLGRDGAAAFRVMHGVA